MFNKKLFIKIVSLFLCIALLLSLSACSKPAKKYNMNFTETSKNTNFVLNKNDDSANIELTQDSIDELKRTIDNIKVDVPYSELFKTEECYNRLNQSIAINTHDSIFNDFAELSGSSLMTKVKDNNKVYLQENTFGYEVPDDDFLLELCDLIIETISKIKNEYPTIDYKRVLCNLSNLKILYKKGMVDNAQVTAEMVLNISPNMFEIVELMSGKNGCRNVVIHEIMHIVQLGCQCENIEHCTMRCGFSYRWDDFDINSTDFRWLFEGSAERMMCNITGDVALTYKYMINYICTMNIATMLNDSVSANYLETLSFYNDVDKLYNLFGCKSKLEKLEILNMLIATNVIQTAPEEFLTAYAKSYNEDTSSSETIDKINYTLKPSVCLIVTKQFYNQLLDLLGSDEAITTNDLMFIINLFEASLDNHLKYTSANNQSYNQKFIGEYLNIRNSLFESISRENAINISKLYTSFEMILTEKTVAASLNWLQEKKIEFLIERVKYLEFNRNSKIQ